MSTATETLYQHAEHLGAVLPAAVVAQLDTEAEVHRQINLGAQLDAAFGAADDEWEWRAAR